MDEIARKEIVASTAAHREPDYDDAMAEGLVEWIGAEVDRQVELRLAQRRAAERAARPGWVPAVLGSMACGLGATAIVILSTATNINGRFNDAVGSAQILTVALILTAIAIVNVAYARRR